MTTKQDDQWCQDLLTKGGFHQVFDNTIPSRARLTCPAGLAIKSVKNHEGKPTFGVFAKRIVQCRTQFGPLHAPVKCKQKRIPAIPNSPPDIPANTESSHPNLTENDRVNSAPSMTDDIVQNVTQQQKSIQEVALDQSNMEHQDIVQQALGIVKVTQQQMMGDDEQAVHTGPYGDAVTSLPNSFHQVTSITDPINLVTTLAGGDMPAPGQFGSGQIGEDLTLTTSLEAGISPSVTESLSYPSHDHQHLIVQGHISQNQLQVEAGGVNHVPSASNTDFITTTIASQIVVQQSAAEAGAQTAAVKVLENVGIVDTAMGSRNSIQPVLSQQPVEGKDSPKNDIEKKAEEHDKRPNPADQPFELKVFLEDEFEEVLDLGDEDKCNWMMFVRPARTAAEQNVVAYQFQEKIFFVSTKPIPSNTEIRVWYSPDYAKEMNKELLLESEVSQQATGYPAKWVCSVCMEGFSTFADLEAHVCTGETTTGSRRLRGRPRKGRPRKYIKPSKTWRARLEKSRLSKTKIVTDPSMPPRKRGRPPKLRAVIVAKPQKEDKIIDFNDELEDNTEITTEEDKEDKDDEMSALDLLDEVLGEDEDDDDIPITVPRRRGRKRKPFGAPRAIRTPKREPMECPHCEAKFTKEALFVVHVSEHTGIKPYICEFEECQKGFMSKFKLERHRLIHTCPRHHKCPYCDKCFNRKDHLKNHMITHDPNKKRWVCEECGKEYSYNFSYRTHKAFHDAEAGRTTECGICHKKYETKEELLYHLKVHSGARSVKNCTEKTHACEDCGKKFYTRKDVRRHMITHTKRKDFLCQFCPQRFGRKDHLTRHLRSSHSGDNPNSKPRALRGERKEREKQFAGAASMVGLTIPREDPNMLITTQPSLINYQHIHTLPADIREIPVPLHMFENASAQPVITMANMSITQTIPQQAQQPTQQQQQQPQQQQQHQQVTAHIQNIQQTSLANQIPITENRYAVDVTTANVRQQTHIESPTPNDYRNIQQGNQTHIPMYVPVGQQQQHQTIVNKQDNNNIDQTRTNGVLQADYQSTGTRTDLNVRPSVLQTADASRQSVPSTQTFSTLLGYMETLRFLENLPTNAQGGVIAQMQMQQDGQHPPTMVPIQTTLSYAVNTTNNLTHQVIPADMQRRMPQHSAYQQNT